MLALVTSSAAAGIDPDLPPLLAAFEAELGGGVASVEHWDDPDVDWARFDAALVRSTWDYVRDLDGFLDWTSRVAPVSSLHNAPDVIRWNSDKRYLLALAGAGIDTVPTHVVPPGRAPPPTHGDTVVKPTVGAGSRGARRCATSAEVAAHVAVLHRAGSTAMIQPYVGPIEEHGESALCFLPGPGGGLEYSHAFSKSAILAGDGPQWDGDLVAREEVTALEPTSDQLALARRVLGAAAAVVGPLAYARVDVVPGPRTPLLMELELIEPSMYFDLAPGSARRAAARWAASMTP